MESKKDGVKYLTPKNLVFAGGGVKCITYASAIAVLDTYLQKLNSSYHQIVKRTAGSSAGSIIALLLALNYSIKDIIDICYEDLALLSENIDIVKLKNLFSNLVNPSLIFNSFNKNITDTILQIFKSYPSSDKAPTLLEGLLSGEAIRNKIEEVISNKLKIDGIDREYGERFIENLTFGQLKTLIDAGKHYKHLYVVTTRLNPQELIYLNSEEEKWKDIVIADAIRASLSTPFIFKPYKLRLKNFENKLVTASESFFIDGGLLANYPISIFDREPKHHTLGFYVQIQQDTVNLDPNESLIQILLNSQRIISGTENKDTDRTINIISDINPVDFGIDIIQKDYLLSIGELAATDFFENQIILTIDEMKSSYATCLYSNNQYSSASNTNTLFFGVKETRMGVSVPLDFVKIEDYKETIKEKIKEGPGANPLYKLLLTTLIDPNYKDEKKFIKEQMNKILEGTKNEDVQHYLNWLKKNYNKVGSYAKTAEFEDKAIDLYIRERREENPALGTNANITYASSV